MLFRSRLSRNPLLAKLDEASCKALNDFVAEYPFIQFACLTDATGKMVCSAIADSEYADIYANLNPGYDFSLL